jgi:futalosine hydrolase
MSFKVLYITATSREAGPLTKIKGIISVPGGYRFENIEIDILVTGIGGVPTAWAMKEWISSKGKPDLAINGGIAGSYKEEYRIGDVVIPISDCFADAGIEDKGNFNTLFEAGLISSNEFPFSEGLLLSDHRYTTQVKSILKPVRAITVNTSTGSDLTKSRFVNKFNPDIETMEGATFFYICAREKIPFLAIRAISNMVEARDKSNWNIALALDNLSEKLGEVFKKLE